MGVSTVRLTKSAFGLRWLMLFLASLLMLGNYYVYDIPAATKPLLGVDETTYSLLYTVYSLPNIVLPFFGGFFVDKFGARACLVVFTLFLVAGQLIFALGSVYKSVPVMLLGRTVYGLGGENLSVGQSALIAEWFKGKELAFAFSVNLSCSRLGSVINQYVSPVVAESWGSVNMALFLGVTICCCSLVCGLIMAPVDKLVESKLARNQGALLSLNANDEDELIDPLLDAEERAAKGGSLKKERMKKAGEEEGSGPGGAKEAKSLWAEFRGFSWMFWALAWCCLVVYGCILPFNNIASSLLQERNYFVPAPAGCHLADPTQCQSDTNLPVDCPTSLWYQPPLPTTVDISKVDCSSTDYNDEGACTYHYCTRQTAGLKQADRVSSIPYTISSVMSPLLGLCVDRFGRRATVVTLAPVVLILVHLALGLWTSLTPVVPLIGQGLAYSAFAAVLWPSVPFTVAEDKVGLGYGLVTAIQNSGLALFPLATAGIYKAANSSYIPGVEVFFVSLACLGVLGGLLLLALDARNGHVLNKVQWHAGSSTPEGEEITTTTI